MMEVKKEAIETESVNNANNRHTLNECFKVFGEQTAIHGIRNLTSGIGFGRRSVWCIILALSFSVLIHQLIAAIIEYKKYNTNISFAYSEESTDFPEVTICNTNMFRLPEVVSSNGGLSWYSSYGKPFLIKVFERGSSKNFVLPPGNEFPGGGNMREFVERTAHPLDKMLKECRFRGGTCNKSNFTEKMTNYGLCYTFLPDFAEINHVGPDYGLRMVLDVEHKHYSSFPRLNVGFKISVDSKGSEPNLGASGINVSPGESTAIALTKKMVSRLEPPYVDCVAEGRHELLYYDEPYTQNKCRLECETKYMMEKCQCRTYYSPGDDSIPFCTPNQTIVCFQKKQAKFNSDVRSICGCPVACETEEFKVSVSDSPYPSAGMMNSLLTGSDSKYIPMAFGHTVRSITALSVYTIDVTTIWTSLNQTLQTIIPVALDTSMCSELYQTLSQLSRDVSFHIFDSLSQETVNDHLKQTENGNAFAKAEIYGDFYVGMKNKSRDSLERSPIREIFDNNLKMCISHQSFSRLFIQKDTQFYVDFFNDFFERIFDERFRFIHKECTDAMDKIVKEYQITTVLLDYFRFNFARVEIYYETLQVEKVIYQIQYDWLTLVSNTGGFLGLFMGASLVAILETIDFWFVQFCERKKRNKSVEIAT